MRKILFTFSKAGRRMLTALMAAAAMTAQYRFAPMQNLHRRLEPYQMQLTGTGCSVRMGTGPLLILTEALLPPAGSWYTGAE